MSKRKTLSERRLQALALVAQGHTHQETAEQLHVSKKTVEKHLEVVRRNLDARTTTHAVALAIKAGLIQP